MRLDTKNKTGNEWGIFKCYVILFNYLSHNWWLSSRLRSTESHETHRKSWYSQSNVRTCARIFGQDGHSFIFNDFLRYLKASELLHKISLLTLILSGGAGWSVPFPCGFLACHSHKQHLISLKLPHFNLYYRYITWTKHFHRFLGRSRDRSLVRSTSTERYVLHRNIKVFQISFCFVFYHLYQISSNFMTSDWHI